MANKFKVGVFFALPADHLMLVELIVSVEQSIAWIRANIDEIVSKAIERDKVASGLKRAPCALSIEAVAS